MPRRPSRAPAAGASDHAAEVAELRRRALGGDLDDASALRLFLSHAGSSPAAPRFYRGHLQINDVHDTYLDTRGLSKGLIWVNGHNLGRYWETRGPQHTLYVPAPYLRRGANEVVILDLDGRTAVLESVTRPRWN